MSRFIFNDEVYIQNSFWSYCFTSDFKVPKDFKQFIDDFILYYIKYSKKERQIMLRDTDIFYNRVKQDRYNDRITFKFLAEKYSISKSRIGQIYYRMLKLFQEFLYREGIIQ